MIGSNTVPAKYAMRYPTLIHFIRQGELDELFDIMTSELLQRRDECERAATQAVDEYHRRRDELEALRQRLSELHVDQARVNNGDAIERRRTTRLQIEAEIEKSTFDPEEAMRAVAGPELSVKDLYILKSLTDELRILGIYKAIEIERSRILSATFSTLDPRRSHAVSYIEKEIPWLRLVFGYPAINELRLIANCIKHSGRVSKELEKCHPTWRLSPEINDAYGREHWTTESGPVWDFSTRSAMAYKRLAPFVGAYFADLAEKCALLRALPDQALRNEFVSTFASTLAENNAALSRFVAARPETAFTD